MGKLAKYKDREIEVKELDVLSSKESWNEYQLEDGKTLLVKTILIEVNRALTEKTPDGELLYLTKTQQIVRVR